jgi:hypothetical protein
MRYNSQFCVAKIRSQMGIVGPKWKKKKSKMTPNSEW